MPRDSTLARENGSWLPTAWTLSSSSLNIATCSPSTSAATPALGTMSSSGQTRTGMASRKFKVGFPLLRARRTDLLALGNEYHTGVRLVAVHEMTEELQDLRRLERLLPLAGVAVD